MTYSRTWVDAVGSDESHGRALWGLGTLVGRSNDAAHRSLAHELFHSALVAATSLASPRAWAFCLLGVDEYLRAFEGDTSVQSVRETLGRQLFQLLESHAVDEWPWFEDRLTYCNARLPHALIATGFRTADEPMLAAGLRSLEWLLEGQRSVEGYFAPIGSNGFHVRGRARASFDQRPIETAATVSACMEARRATEERVWTTRARHAFNWFLGQNELQWFLHDPVTGVCHDGLHEHGLIENQGSEATLAFLTSLLEMRALDQLPDPIRSAVRLEPRAERMRRLPNASVAKRSGHR
jgi:hypothetical protein